MESTTITVSKPNAKSLKRIKLEKDYSTLDDVITSLLNLVRKFKLEGELE